MTLHEHQGVSNHFNCLFKRLFMTTTKKILRLSMTDPLWVKYFAHPWIPLTMGMWSDSDHSVFWKRNSVMQCTIQNTSAICGGKLMTIICETFGCFFIFIAAKMKISLYFRVGCVRIIETKISSKNAAGMSITKISVEKTIKRTVQRTKMIARKIGVTASSVGILLIFSTKAFGPLCFLPVYLANLYYISNGII